MPTICLSVFDHFLGLAFKGLSKEEHEQLLTNAVTSTYKNNKQFYQEKDQYGRQTNFKKQRNSKPCRENGENGENNCFFTLKDHKDNFANNPQVRLIDPAKNELGKISKVILDKINLAIREHFSFNQWKNTQNVIDWFNEIPRPPAPPQQKKKFTNL